MSEVEIRDCEHCKNHEYEYSRSKGMWVHGCKKWDCEFEKKEFVNEENRQLEERYLE